MSKRLFKIIGTNYRVDWDVVSPFEDQARY